MIGKTHLYPFTLEYHKTFSSLKILKAVPTPAKSWNLFKHFLVKFLKTLQSLDVPDTKELKNREVLFLSRIIVKIMSLEFLISYSGVASCSGDIYLQLQVRILRKKGFQRSGS